MRRFATAAVVALLLASGYTLSRAQDRVDEPLTAGAIVVGEAGPTQPTWEYEIYPVGGVPKGRKMVEVFNELGQDGWEYSGTIQSGEVYLFKRSKR